MVMSVSVGDVDQHAIIKRQDHARDEEVIEIDAVLVEHAIALGALVQRDATLRLVLASAVDVLHVGAHFHDIHPTIAIKGEGHRLHDRRLAHDEFQGIAFGERDGL